MSPGEKIAVVLSCMALAIAIVAMLLNRYGGR